MQNRRLLWRRLIASRLAWLVLLASVILWPAFAQAADYMADAQKSLAKGDLRAALIQLRNAVKADPQSGAARYALARTEFDLGDVVSAEQEARAARDRGYDPSAAVPLLMQTYLAQGKYDALLNDFHADGKEPALDAQIDVARGNAQLALSRPDDAAKSYADAQKAAPTAVEPILAKARLAMARGDPKAAQDAVDWALSVQPKSIEALLSKAQLLQLKGDSKGALEALNQAAALAPTSLPVKLERAGVLLGTGAADQAKADIDQVLAATPGSVQGNYMLALWQTRQKDYKAADATLGRLAPVLSRIPRAYFVQAVVKQNLGLVAQAEEAAQRYVARAPNDLDGYKLLAKIQLQRGRPDLGIDALGKVVASGHADAETYDLLGRAYALTNRPDLAVGSFQKAQELAPNDLGVQTRLAGALLGSGNPDGAVSDLERSLQLAPTQTAVGDALFYAAMATGDLDKVAAALDRIKAAQGDTPTVANLAGMLQLAKLDYGGAQAAFKAILDKSPDFVPARINLARVLVLQGHPDEAAKLLAGLLAKDPTLEPALTILVTLQVQLGRAPDAIATMQRAHAAAPANQRLTAALADMYTRSGDAKQALDLLNTPLPDAATPGLEMLSALTRAQLALGQTTPARQTLAKILEVDASIIVARRELVSLLIQAGEYESAKSLIQAGLAISPRNYQLLQDYTMVDLKQNGLDAAVATAERLQSQDRDFAAARALKGDVYLAAKQPDDAVKAYREALTAAPGNLFVTRLAGALDAAGHPDQAAQALRDWLAQHQDDAVVAEVLSSMDIRARRLDDARQHLAMVLEQRPHDTVALNNLAWVYQQMGDRRAADLARQAYLLAPGAQTADTFGWILTTGGDAGAGLSLLRQASAEAPANAEIGYHYAVALKNTGQKDQAIKVLTQLVSGDTAFDEKEEARKLLTELTKGT